MSSPSHLQDVEQSVKLNGNQSSPEVTCTTEVYPSIKEDSSGIAHSLDTPGIFDSKNVTNSNVIDDTRAIKAEGRSHDDKIDITPDITAETQKEDSQTCIVRYMMKKKEKPQKYQDSLNLHKTPSLTLEMPSDYDCNFIREFVDLHNKYRAKHKVPPLELSKELSVFSENWADRLAKRNVMENSNISLGENIFYKYGFDMDPNEPVDFWYKEGIDYAYGSTDFHHKTGHFTQLVWKETKDLGVGIAKNPSTGIFVVAHYYPPGNVQGGFPFNVLPPSD